MLRAKIADLESGDMRDLLNEPKEFDGLVAEVVRRKEMITRVSGTEPSTDEVAAKVVEDKTSEKRKMFGWYRYCSFMKALGKDEEKMNFKEFLTKKSIANPSPADRFQRIEELGLAVGQVVCLKDYVAESGVVKFRIRGFTRSCDVMLEDADGGQKKGGGITPFVIEKLAE